MWPTTEKHRYSCYEGYGGECKNTHKQTHTHTHTKCNNDMVKWVWRYQHVSTMKCIDTNKNISLGSHTFGNIWDTQSTKYITTV